MAAITCAAEAASEKKETAEYTLTIFENERWVLLQGFSAEHLFPTERGNLSHEDGEGDYQRPGKQHFYMIR